MSHNDEQPFPQVVKDAAFLNCEPCRLDTTTGNPGAVWSLLRILMMLTQLPSILPTQNR